MLRSRSSTPAMSPRLTRAEPMLSSACAWMSGRSSASAISSASRPRRIASSFSFATMKEDAAMVSTLAFAAEAGASSTSSTARFESSRDRAWSPRCHQR